MLFLTLTRFSFINFILLSFLVVSCSSSNKPATPLPPPLPPTQPVKLTKKSVNLNEAPVEHIRIMSLESFPIQVNVIARGNLPDNCTMIDQITETQNDNTLIVNITTIRQTNKVCSKTPKPFEEIIPLNVIGLSAGIYTVKVNKITDSFELSMDNIIN